MKSILLKLAHMINKHYNTIELEPFNSIKYMSDSYDIRRINSSMEQGVIELEITAVCVSPKY